MEVAFAFLCDYADQSGGKISAIGVGFDTIFAREVPVKHPLFYAVIGLRFSTVETGPKQIGVRVIATDGEPVVPPLDITVNVEPPVMGYTYRSKRLAVALYGVEFKQFADYAVVWLAGGTEISRVPLKVAPPPISPKTA